jgi:hypothetical protein
MSDTKDQQVKRVVEGMAVAVLAAGVEALTSSKVALELGFNAAWRRWVPASRFPTISGVQAGNLFWGGMGKSAGRKGVNAAWRSDGPWTRPFLLQDWELNEFLEDLADDRATAQDWRELGQLYVATFEADQLSRSVPAEVLNDGVPAHRRASEPGGPAMNLFTMAFDDMNAIDLKSDELTVDQKLKIAEIKALLSISQELSKIHHEGINPEYDQGD